MALGGGSVSLGHRIRQLRQARGLTQSQLGQPELSKSFISLLEKDRTQPSLDTLLLISQRLGTSVDALLAQKGNIPAAVCEGLLALSREAVEARRHDEAQRYLETIDFLATKHGLTDAISEMMLQQAQIALDQRAFDIALTKADSAYHAAEARSDEWRAGRSILTMGYISLRQREFPAAQAFFERALLKLRRAKAGRDPARIEALIGLGTTLTRMGRYANAIRRYGEAVRSDVAQHNPKLRGQALWGIGWAERKVGNLDVAKEFLLQAKDAFEQAEDLSDLMRVLHNIGQVLHEQGRSREALKHLHHAMRVADRMKSAANIASMQTEIGRVNVSLGNLEDAEHFAKSGLRGAIAVDDQVEVAEAKVVLAEIRVRRNDIVGAIELMKDAVSVFRERKMTGKVAVVARELGLMLRSRGAHAQASEYLVLSLEHSKSAGNAPRETAPVND
jgi:tetratricopeptide (TPR) repeat protein